VAISSNKMRTNIIISKSLKAFLQVEAEKQNRSFNNLVITLLKEFSKEKGWKEPPNKKILLDRGENNG
jgi:hypothetical protein